MSDHNKLFDGIAQADNEMPKWYIVSFIVSMIIGVLYFGYYHGVTDFQQENEYSQSVAAFKKAHPEKKVVLDAKSGNPFANDAQAISEGETVFATTCAACHKADATGLVGPDLTDAKWLHGNSEKDVFDVIMEGRMGENTRQSPSMGPMPAHKASLGDAKSWKIVAWMKNKFKNIK